ncbi:MAG: diphosphomevalonate decarboxylase [Bacteroidota bacterium]
MIDYKNPKLVVETGTIEPGSVSWRSPSNIALIKYWGKYGKQLPRNPSISFTLDKAYTETTLKYEPKIGADTGVELDFYFNGALQQQFGEKTRKFLASITEIYPFLKQLKLSIHTKNSFPHSAGIASSASGMSAIALCLCTLEEQLFERLESDDEFRRKASYLSRLGSGSACRSIFAKMAVWGESSDVEGSSNLYAVPYVKEVHETFKTFHDDILIVSKGEKAVSSRAGHALMEDNIYASNRYQQARKRFHDLLSALKDGDLEVFGRITENEALTLHAMMMCANPSYLLMRPNTIKLIELVRAYRTETQQPLYFSLDAGPNLHLLYPDMIKSEVQTFIQSELVPFCENGEVIADITGEGPLQL